MSKSDLSIENKLSKIKYISDENSHLILNQELCKTCESKECTYVCPARVYTKEQDGTIKIEYENCLECKACKVACHKGAISWNYPKSAKGVTYKFS